MTSWKSQNQWKQTFLRGEDTWRQRVKWKDQQPHRCSQIGLPSFSRRKHPNCKALHHPMTTVHGDFSWPKIIPGAVVSAREELVGFMFSFSTESHNWPQFSGLKQHSLLFIPGGQGPLTWCNWILRLTDPLDYISVLARTAVLWALGSESLYTLD